MKNKVSPIGALLCVALTGCAGTGDVALDCHALGRIDPAGNIHQQAGDWFARNDYRAVFTYASTFYACPCAGTPSVFAGGEVSDASAGGEVSGASAGGEVSGASAGGEVSGASAGGELSGASAGGEVSGASAGGEVSGASAGSEVSGTSAGGEVSGGFAGGGLSALQCLNFGVDVSPEYSLRGPAHAEIMFYDGTAFHRAVVID